MLDINVLNGIREAKEQGFTLEEILIAALISNLGTNTEDFTPKIDLSSLLAPRKTPKATPKARKARETHRPRPIVSPSDMKIIRAWAKEQGLIRPGQRGKTSPSVVDAFIRAHKI